MPTQKSNVTPIGNGASPEYNLDALLAQREEARGGGDPKRVYFRFKDRDWSFLDPQFMTDEEKIDLEKASEEEGFNDIDLAAWYMGEEQYGEFVQEGGNSSAFFIVFGEHRNKLQESMASGKPTTPNRYSRRHQNK